MIALYNSKMTRSTRVLWLLEELGADYEIVSVSIARPDGAGGPDPKNPHPLKQVPVVLINGEIVVESLAIWLHLTDLHPDARMAPPPGDPQRTEYIGWMGLSTAVFEPLLAAAASDAALTDRMAAAKRALRPPLRTVRISSAANSRRSISSIRA